MKKYKINIFSNTHAIISSLGLIFLFAYTIDLIPSGINKAIDFVIFFAILIFLFLVVVVFSKGKVEIEINDNGFRHTWIERFIFSKEKNIQLEWQEIIDFAFEEDRLFENFRLTLLNNRKYKIFRWIYFFQKDDFKKFENEFPKYLKKLNQNENIDIKAGKLSYEEPVIMWFMRILAIISVVLISVSFIYPQSQIKSLPLLVCISAFAFYEFQIQSKKKAREKKKT